MKKLICYILFTCALMAGSPVNAQLQERADKHFKSFSYQEAARLYENLWQKDSSDMALAKKLAVSYRKLNNSKEAEKWYAKVTEQDNANAEDYFHYSKALQGNGKYREAKIWMDRCLEHVPAGGINSIDPEYISSLQKDSLRYRITQISANSEASDFGVTYYGDELVFSSAKEKPGLIERNHQWTGQDYLRLYQGKITDSGDVEKASLFSGKLETGSHDGPVCFSADGSEMFLTRNHLSASKRARKNEEGVVDIKLYYSKKEGNKWTKPELLPFNMEGYSTGHPALSADGKKLYFISDRPGGYGGTDLYVSGKTESGWGNPVNLGNKVNSPANEMSPFVNETGKLFFASEGHPGLGGLDLFSINLDDPGAEPINMGYPINTAKDDFGLIIKNGEGYFASNRVLGESYDDIYHFSVLSQLLKGQVFNSETNEIIAHSKVFLLSEKGELIESLTATEEGKFQFLIPNVDNYKVKSVKENFSDGLETLSAESLADSPEFYLPVYQTPDVLFLDGLIVYRDDRSPVQGVMVSIKEAGTEKALEMSSDAKGKFSGLLKRGADYSIKYYKQGLFAKTESLGTSAFKGDTLFVIQELMRPGYVMENIFYDLDKADIRTDAALVLDRVAEVMKLNPELNIELASHTDARSSKAYNMALSDRRAKAAVKYLVSKGISSDRLDAKGYGETKPVNNCADGVKCSEEKHQQNRRTEVKVRLGE